jgi:ATP-binding cassette subfamily F protein uup
VIADYEGTVLLVSHDRDFLDRTVTVTLGLDGSGMVDIVAGGYAEWEQKRKDTKAPKKAAGAQKNITDQQPARSSSSAKKLSYKDQRDYDLLPDRIEAIELRIGEIEALLANPDLYAKEFATFEKLTQENSALLVEKDEAEMRWLELAEQVEQLATS